jgi:hypothetical protein
MLGQGQTRFLMSAHNHAFHRTSFHPSRRVISLGGNCHGKQQKLSLLHKKWKNQSSASKFFSVKVI